MAWHRTIRPSDTRGADRVLLRNPCQTARMLRQTGLPVCMYIQVNRRGKFFLSAIYTPQFSIRRIQLAGISKKIFASLRLCVGYFSFLQWTAPPGQHQQGRFRWITGTAPFTRGS